MVSSKRLFIILSVIGLVVVAGLLLNHRHQSNKIRLDFGKPEAVQLLLTCFGSAVCEQFRNDESFESVVECENECYRKDIEPSILRHLSVAEFCGFGFTTPDYFLQIFVNGEPSVKFEVVYIKYERNSSVRTGLQFSEGLAFPCSQKDKVSFDLFLKLSGLVPMP